MGNKEKWKDIEDYEGIYQVSNKGVIRSKLIPTRQGTVISEEWHILEESLKYDGVPKVALIDHTEQSNSDNPDAPHKRTYKYVARLVLEAFVGKPPSEEHQALRLDSNWENVELSNLKWGTRKEMARLMKKNETMAVGELLPQHKLCSDEVREIKEELVNGYLNITEIAEIFDVSFNCIRDIKENNNWKHVEWPEGNINDYTFKECKFCGDQFETDRFIHGGAPEKYCSDQCRKNQDKLYAAKRKSTQEYKNKAKLNASGDTYEEHFGTYKGTCDCCGEEYEVDLSVRLEGEQPDYFSKKYCSKKCAKRQSYLNSIDKSYEEVYGTIEKDCEFCGQTFELGPDDYKGQKYCRSESCDRERERARSAKRRWNGKGYWDREGKNDKLQRNYT